MNKITLTFKTPDVLDTLEVDEEKNKEAKEKLKKWLKWEELVSIEFDLDKMEAHVLEN